MRKFLSSFCILILIISFFPINVLASNDDISLSQFNIQTDIKQNGDLGIKELITYDFKDNFNGAYRDISIKNTGGIRNIKVAVVLDNGKNIYFKESASAKNGDNYLFQVISKNNDIYRIKIYSPSKKEQKTFKITYTIKNTAVKYKDTAQLFYTYWSDYNKTEIDNLKIHINFPENTPAKTIKAYFHGISNGNISIEDGSVTFSFPHVNSKELVETRVLFPAQSIPLSTNIKNEKALDRILDYESNYKAEQERKKYVGEKLKDVFNYITTLLGACAIILMILMLKKFRFHNHQNKYSYNTYYPPELPEECTPAVASLFIHKVINGMTLYSTILDLWRKGYLAIEKADKNKPEFLIKKNKDSDSSLLNHERYFIKWLFSIIGNGYEVTTVDIKTYSKKSSFYKDMNKWKSLVHKELKSKNYYDKSASKAGIKLIFISIASIIFSIISLIINAYMGGFFLIISILMLILGTYYCSKKTPAGENMYKNWIKFENYIKNSNLNYDIHENYIGKYIPYVEALNLRKIGISKLKNTFENSSGNMNWIYYYFIFDNLGLDKSLYTSFGINSSGIDPSSSSGSSGGSSGGGGAGGF